MADYTLSDLNGVSAIAADDLLHLRNTSGLDKKITWAALRNILDPVGTIKMFDGATWTDNSTIAGWYACIAANAAQGCPNLVDQFIKGGTTATVLDTGGAATHTLGATEIPSHTHSIAHDHGAASTGSHKHNNGMPIENSTAVGALPYGTMTISGNRSCTQTLNLATESTAFFAYSQTVSVSVNLPAYAGNSDGGTGGGLAHNNEPQYYKLIFIRKCS